MENKKKLNVDCARLQDTHWSDLIFAIDYKLYKKKLKNTNIINKIIV